MSELGPKFEKNESVPWDESIIPEGKRAWIRGLYEDPQKQKAFWEELYWSERPELQQLLNRWMKAGFTQVDIEYKVFYDDRGFPIDSKIEEFGGRVAKAVESSGFNKEFFLKNHSNRRIEEWRVFFDEEVKFLKENGVPEDRLNLGRLIAEGYKFAADIVEMAGLDPKKNYPMEESTEKLLMESVRKTPIEITTEDEISLDIREPLSAKEREEVAEHSRYFLRQEMYRDFEARYQVLRKNRGK